MRICTCLYWICIHILVDLLDYYEGIPSTDEDYRLRTREITFRKVNRVNEKKTVVVKLLKDGNPEPQESFNISLCTLNGVVYDKQHVQVLIKDRN